jgi:hypothetical protein
MFAPKFQNKNFIVLAYNRFQISKITQSTTYMLSDLLVAMGYKSVEKDLLLYCNLHKKWLRTSGNGTRKITIRIWI